MLTKQLLRFLAPVAVMMAFTSACGSDPKTATDVPSLNGTKSSGSVTTTTIDPEEAVQKFVACLREQGLEVADPKVGSDGQVDMRSIFENADIQPGSDDFRAAQEKCGSLLANAGFGPSEESQKARQEAMLAFTSCLRKEGLEVGDVTFGGPGGPGGGGPGGGGPGGGFPGGGGPGGAPGGTPQGDLPTGGTGAGANAPTPPARDGAPATEEERNARLAERLSLDASDPAVTAAFEACSTELSAINTGPGGPGGPGATTTTTEG